jgi:hypothetical protein
MVLLIARCVGGAGTGIGRQMVYYMPAGAGSQALQVCCGGHGVSGKSHV